MAEQNHEEKTELALAIEQRKRKLYAFDVEGFFGLGERAIPKLRIRTLMKNEENAAIVAAHARAKGLSRDDSDTRSDADLLDDLKLKEALQRACFIERDTKGGQPVQAFPGGDWMEKNFSTDQLAVLWNLLQEVKKAESPMLYKVEKEQVMSFAEACAKTADSQIPEQILAGANRTYLTTAFTLLACEWWKLKQQHEVIDDVLSSEDGDEPGLGSETSGEEASSDPGADAGSPE